MVVVTQHLNVCVYIQSLSYVYVDNILFVNIVVVCTFNRGTECVENGTGVLLLVGWVWYSCTTGSGGGLGWWWWYGCTMVWLFWWWGV